MFSFIEQIDDARQLKDQVKPSIGATVAPNYKSGDQLSAQNSVKINIKFLDTYDQAYWPLILFLDNVIFLVIIP